MLVIENGPQSKGNKGRALPYSECKEQSDFGAFSIRRHSFSLLISTSAHWLLSLEFSSLYGGLSTSGMLTEIKKHPFPQIFHHVSGQKVSCTFS
jgi:hypothetical protein